MIEAESDLSGRWTQRPLILAVVVQALGTALAIVLFLVMPELLQHPLVAAAVQGASSTIVSHFLKAPWWWQLIHLLFAPLVALALALSLPPALWLGAFVFLFLIFWRTDISRVPLYLSSKATASALERLLPASPCFVLDAGCGDGRMLRQLARKRPDCEFVGIEHAPLVWLYARLRATPLNNLHVRLGNFWQVPFAPYDVVYAFLSPAPMAAFWQKANAEMRPDALLVSNSFAIPAVEADNIVSVADRQSSRLWVYRVRGDGGEQKHCESAAVLPIDAVRRTE